MVNSQPQSANQMIFKILLAICLGSVIGHFMPSFSTGILILRGFITFSDIVSDFLSFFVPIAVLTLVMPGIMELGSKASKMLIIGISLSFISFIVIGLICLIVGYKIIPLIFDVISIHSSIEKATEYKGFLPTILTPFFDIITAMGIAFAFGIAGTKVNTENTKAVLKEIEACSYKIINGFLIPLLPLYVFSIMAKLSAGGALLDNIGTFGLVIACIFVISNGFVLFTMFIIAKLTKRSFFYIVKAYLPVYLIGFGTRSSKATIPFSLIAAEKIGISKEIREFGIPFLAASHMLGDMATQVFGAIAFYYIFTGEMLPVSLAFSYVFLLASILMAAPGTPGGAVVTTKPFLTSFLGFPAPAAETFFAIGIANDSFATATNVMGDGVIIMILEAIRKKLGKENMIEDKNKAL